jgi:hypothetical protein
VSLPADADLASSIIQALDRSRFLVVLCSPRVVESQYVAEEVVHFKQVGKVEGRQLFYELKIKADFKP